MPTYGIVSKLNIFITIITPKCSVEIDDVLITVLFVYLVKTSKVTTKGIHTIPNTTTIKKHDYRKKHSLSFF